MKRKVKHRKWLALILVLAVAAVPLMLSVNETLAASALNIVPGNYRKTGSGLTTEWGSNGYLIYGIKEGANYPYSFAMSTFCTHKGWNGSGNNYTRYYNTDPDESAANKTLAAILNAAELSAAQYRTLRYCMVYTTLHTHPQG